MDKLRKVSRAHTQYKTSDGKRVPGATTITGLRAKPQLVKWANRLGLEGIDSSKYTDESAIIGTLAHALILENLTGDKVDTSTFSAQQIDMAENSLLSFLQWKSKHEVVPIICEKPMVSDTLMFGGTVDCYCLLDGVETLVDFKTGKSIYTEYFAQTSAYAELLREHGYPVNEIRILRVGRDEHEGFEERTITDTTMYFKWFRNMLDNYYIEKIIGWN